MRQTYADMGRPGDVLVNAGTFKTATGKIFRTDFFSFPGGTNYGYIRILDSNFSTVSTVFDDPKETAILEYGGHQVTGYKMNYCQHDGNAVKIFLQKGV